MSVDINVYVGDFTNITKEGCERYLLQFGLKAQVHPDANFETDTGFIPFKVEYLSVDTLKNKAFITGFEIYTSKYDYEQELDAKEKKQIASKKAQGIMGVFKKKNQESTIEETKFIINTEADELLKRCNYEVNLTFHEMHEGLISSAFASYLAETGNGVIYDTSSGEYLYEDIKQKSLEEVKDFFEVLETNELHLFEGWE